MATYIDKIKYNNNTIYKLIDSGASHDTDGILIGTTGDFKTDGTIYANNGIFNYIKAIDGNISNLSVDDLRAKRATVAIRLDVEGELHTNSWTASNISTIDGAFYITPTVSCESGTFNYDGTQITVSAASNSSFAIDDLYMGGSSTALTSSWWTKYSYVIITGDVRENTTTGEWKPLGTIRGNIYSASTSTIVINSLTDSRGSSTLITLQDIGTGNRTFRNIKISLYKRATSSTVNYPIGIYMTAMGTKGKTFLDIYGGDNQTGVDISNTISNVTHNSGALAKPKVRIGNLLGLPALTLPNGTSVNPTGWGIYTNNGFFEGTIVSQQGKIGNFTLGTAIYGAASGTGPSTISATTAGTYLGTDGFRSNKSGDTTTYVRITDGVITAKGADISGTITANSGTIGGWTANSSYGLYTNSKTTATSTNSGILIQKDGGIYAGAYNSTNGACPFQVTSAGVLTATSGKIGGWNISATALCSATTYTPAANRILLAPSGISSSTSVGGSSGTLSWGITVGTGFGVTTGGKLYATGAEISGNLTASSLKINGTDYIEQIPTISSKASGDAEYSVEISTGAIDFSANSGNGSYPMTATIYKLGVKQTSGSFTFKWYKDSGTTAVYTSTGYTSSYTATSSGLYTVTIE